MAEALTKESTYGADTEPDSVTNVVAFTAADAKEGTEPSGEELSEDVKQDDDSDDENTFPFDSLDDFEVVDEVEDPVDDGDNEAADKDEQNGSEEGLPEVNEDDVVMEETAEIDLESERPAEHTSQEEHGDAEEISGNLVESLEDPNKEENMGEERTEELKETEEVEEGGDEAGEDEELQDEDTVEGEKGAEEEYEEEVEGEGEEVEGEEEEEMEAEEQEEYEEEEEVVEEEYIEGEEVREEEVEEEEDEEVVEGDEEFIEGEQEVEIEEEAEEEGCEPPEEQALETEVEGMAAADNLPSKASRQNLRKKTAKNLLNLQKAVIIYHVKPDDLKDVLLQPCLKKAVCFCVRFLGPKGCTKGGHLEARFSSQKEAKEQMEMINSTIFKNGQKMKSFLLGPGGGPMDWLLNEWQRSISPAGIFESRCVFVSNVPSFAREEMLRALYPTAESVNLPLKPDGQTNGYAMLEYPTQEEAEEIVQYSEKFQARIGNSNLKLTILGQTKIPSGNEMTPVEPAVQVKSDKGYPHSDTGSTRTKTLTEFKSAQVKQTVKPKDNKNHSVKADSSTKSVPKKDDTKVTKVSEKEKNDPKKVSKSTDSGKRTSVKESGKDKKAHRKKKLSDSSKKSNNKDDFNRGNNRTRRDSKQSGSTSRRSERWSPGRSSRSHRSTSSSRKSQESRSSDKKKASSSSEKGKSSSKSVDKPKNKDTKPQTDGKKTDLSVTGKKVSENQGGQKTNATSGEKKKSGTIIPVQLGRTGNASKRPMETSVNINRSDKRSRFDVPTTGPGPVGPYPIGMNPGSGGPMMRGNFPQQQPHVVRPPVPPNMMNPGMGRMPSQNFSPQNMMMGQSQPMTQSVSQSMSLSVSQPMPQPVSQPGMNTNVGPSGVPSTGAPGLDQPMMGPMYMGPGQMNRQQQGYVMDNRNPSNWPPNRISGNMANNWDKSGGGRGESPEEIHNLRGELLKQLQVLETGNVSDPSDLSYIAQKLKQVQQSRNQGGFTGPQQGGFPRGPQRNHQQPQTGPQRNVQGSFQNAPNINQQGNFPSQPNMQQQQQQAVYRDWPNQSSGAGPQGDPSNQYGYQSYSNNNLQSSMPYEGKQMHGDNSGMLHPGGMDNYHTSRGSGMPGGMPPYDSDRGVDRRDISVSQLKKLKTICVQNLPKPINYIEVKKFIRKEMVSRNLCNPKDLPVIYVHASKKGYSSIVFDTEIQANNALQLDGINFQGHILNIRKMWL